MGMTVQLDDGGSGGDDADVGNETVVAEINITPLTDALYNGLPMATQSILQNQNNQDPRLGYSVTAGQ